MPGWVGFIIAIGALVALAPFVAAFGRRHGKAVRGTAGLALVLLGFGQAFDPPKRHLVEAIEGEEQGSESTGEPKDATGGS